jgi:hypothetical protein
LLNCIAKFSKSGESNCKKTIPSIITPCKRLTSDLYPGIMNNYYMKPSHKNPYYYIINPDMNIKISGKTPVLINIHSGTSN